MKIGMTELIVIFIVALIILGPDKLPVYAKKFGEALRAFKKYSSEATKEIRENVVAPLEEAQKPLKEALEPITDIQKTVEGEVKDLKKSLTGIGKTPVKEQSKEKSEAAGASAPASDAEAAPSIASDPASAGVNKPEPDPIQEPAASAGPDGINKKEEV